MRLHGSKCTAQGPERGPDATQQPKELPGHGSIQPDQEREAQETQMRLLISVLASVGAFLVSYVVIHSLVRMLQGLI